MVILLFKNSTINWCEHDYYYSEYIAEFYNSFTGFFLCLSPMLFYYNYRKDSKLYMCIFYFTHSLTLLFIVGVGTILFHSTLLYIFQLVDEIPMLLLCIEYDNLLNKLLAINNINTLHSYENKYKKRFLITQLTQSRFFKYSLCIVVALIGFINNTMQIVIFQFTIAAFVIFILINLYKVFVQYNLTYNNLLTQKTRLENSLLHDYKYANKLTTLKKIIKLTQHYNEELKYSKIICLFTGISSIIVWKYDELYCGSGINFISGHAVWHVLTSICLYHVNKILLIFFIVKTKSLLNPI